MQLPLLDRLTAIDLPREVGAQLGLPPEPLRLQRAWPRTEHHLLLEYLAADGTLVPGQWHRSRVSAEGAAAALPERHAACLGLEVSADDEAGGVVLQLRGADRRMPRLVTLLGRQGAQLLVHVPGRRAVLRRAGTRGVVFVKVVPPGEARAVAAAGQAAEALGGGLFDTPHLLACHHMDGAVFWSAVAGAPLHELRGPALERGARAAGAALRALHDSALPACARPHRADAEIATIDRWLARTAAFAPAVTAQAEELAAPVRARLAARPEALTLVHRDFYDKQVLIDGDGRVGLLDFDTLAVGEPALDLANAVVHFELRALQGLIATAQAEQAAAAFVAGYRPRVSTLQRLGPYIAATRLRLVCVYAFRPRWRQCVALLLDRVREASADTTHPYASL